MKKIKTVCYMLFVCLFAANMSLGVSRDVPGAGNIAIVVMFSEQYGLGYQSGIFITDEIVLTAAHGVNDVAVGDVYVLKRSKNSLFSGDIRNDDLSVLSEINVMPKFNDPKVPRATHLGDIALLKLAEPDPLPGYEGFQVKIGDLKTKIENKGGEILWPLYGAIDVNDIDPNHTTIRFLKKTKRVWSGNTARENITIMQQDLIDCGVGGVGDVGLHFIQFGNHLNGFFVSPLTEHEFGMSGATLYAKNKNDIPNVVIYAVYVGGVLFSDIGCNDTTYAGYGVFLNLNHTLYRNWITSNVNEMTLGDLADRYMRQVEEAIHEQSQTVYWNPITEQSQTVRFELREDALFGPPIALDEMIEADSMQIRYTVDQHENIIGDIDLSFEALAYGDNDKMYPVFVEGTLYQPSYADPDRHELELTVSFTRYNAPNPYPGRYFYRHPPDGVALGGSFTLRVPYADGYDDFTILMDTIESLDGGGIQ